MSIKEIAILFCLFSRESSKHTDVITERDVIALSV